MPIHEYMRCFVIGWRMAQICFYSTLCILTHWGRDKMDSIFQTTFPNAFSSMEMFEFRLKFHWSLFLRVQLTISQHWFRKWLGAVQATSHYLNQWWLVYWRIYASPGLNELTMQTHTVSSYFIIHLQLNICMTKWNMLTVQWRHNENDGV